MKVLVVDDSALMRKLLVEVFTAEGFSVEIARNGAEALKQVHAFEPDVVSLDINMPEMDGLTCLSRIMTEAPRPVVMVSSLTEKGAAATFEAMALGAVDYIAKPGGTISLNIEQMKGELVRKIRAASRARIRQSRGLVKRIQEANKRTRTAPSVRPQRRASKTPGCVLIGVSTGGPRTLEEILPELPGDFPWPVMVAQHMPNKFTPSFASRLNAICALEVQELHQATLLRPGTAYVIRGDTDATFSSRIDGVVAQSRPASSAYRWHPAVSLMVESAMSVFDPQQLVAVMLTGMGDDGAKEMTALRQRGGRVIAESEETAVVWGMPGELVSLGGANLVLPCDKIGNQLIRWIG